MKITVFLSGALLLAPIAFSQAAKADNSVSTLPPPSTVIAGPVAGSKEYGASANLQFNSGHPYAVSAFAGGYQSSTLEVGGVGSFSGSDNNGSFASVGAFANFFARNDGGAAPNANTTTILPYIGGFLGASVRENKLDASIGGQAGAKMLVGQSSAITAEIQYRSTKTGTGDTEFTLGVSFFK